MIELSYSEALQLQFVHKFTFRETPQEGWIPVVVYNPDGSVGRLLYAPPIVLSWGERKKGGENMEEEVSLEQFLQEIKNLEEEDVVKSISVSTAGEVFGEAAKDPERKVLVVETEKGARVTVSLPKGTEWREGKIVIVNKFEAARSLSNPNSKMVQWIRTYGSAPRVGQRIRVYINEDGFTDVVLRR